MHARSRKIALAPPPSRDEIEDAFPSDDAVVIEIASIAEETTRPNERICLGCGSDGSRHEGCSHAEVARLHEPSRAAGELVARLRRAAAEHRAASRALRALVTSELGRGRAELETTEAPPSLDLEAEAPPAAIRHLRSDRGSRGAVCALRRARSREHGRGGRRRRSPERERRRGGQSTARRSQAGPRGHRSAIVPLLERGAHRRDRGERAAPPDADTLP